MKLREAQATDIEQLRGWFTDSTGLRNWGGPNFRFPTSRKSFAEDCKWGELASWSAADASGRLIAFGQAYPKLGRAHLARIALAPDVRGNQLGTALVQSLIEVAGLRLQLAACGLYVWRDNLPAVKCYQRCGFEQRAHEEDLTQVGMSSRDIERLMYMVKTPKG